AGVSKVSWLPTSRPFRARMTEVGLIDTFDTLRDPRHLFWLGSRPLQAKADVGGGAVYLDFIEVGALVAGEFADAAVEALGAEWSAVVLFAPCPVGMPEIGVGCAGFRVGGGAFGHEAGD